MSLVNHLGWLAALTVKLGTNFVTARSNVSLKILHALFASRSANVFVQFMFFRYALCPIVSTLFQLDLVGLSDFLTTLNSSSIFRMQWSLLPTRPSSFTHLQILLCQGSLLRPGLIYYL